MSKRNVNRGAYIIKSVVFVFLTLYVISQMSMYLWAFLASLKTKVEFSQSVISFPKGMPFKWAWSNYVKAFREIKVNVVLPNYRGPVYFDTMLLNSILYTVGGALVYNFTTWLVAYLMVKFKNIRFNVFLYSLNVILMTFPVYGTLPAALKIYNLFGWYDNYSFILFNNISFVGVNLMYFHAYISDLGNEYYEAAYIDGAGNFNIMMKIAFPLTSSMFWVFFLTGAITRWNDYMTMLIWMPNYPTLAYGLYKAGVSSATTLSFPPLQIAVCMTLMLPMLILFLLFHDSMLGNLRVGALKG